MIPVPDPTKLTTEAVDRATGHWQRELAGAREVISVRVDGIEQAARLRHTAIDAATVHQREYLLARIESNAASIKKSEDTTAETIRTNSDLAMTALRAQADKVDDLKDRLIKLETQARTASQVVVDRRAQTGSNVSLINVAISALSIIIAVISVMLVFKG